MSTATAPEAILAEGSRTRPARLWRDTLNAILHQRSAVVGLSLLILLILVALLADVIASYDPNQTLLGVEDGISRRSPPCVHALGCPTTRAEHILGTDGNFRDVFSRVVHGARTSLTVGLTAIIIAVLFGTTVGAIAGFAGGAVDVILMRFMDVLLAFPSLLLAIAIVTALGPSLTNALLAIGIVSIPIYARIVRASVLDTRERDFVTASRALGESGIGILARRILPNSVTPLVVAATLGIGSAVLEIAALSFVGVTGDLTRPEWGSMIGLERNQLFSAPHVIVGPALAITLTVLAFTLIGDGLRDALDPRLNR